MTIDTHRAYDLGCAFRKTGNGVWLCEHGIPPEAIQSIEEWDHPETRRKAPGEPQASSSTGERGGEEPASSSAGRGYNSAALDLKAYR